jgi:phage terminase large subunit
MDVGRSITLSHRYEALFEADTRYIIIIGGRGSGKSFAVATFLSLLSYENDETILFTRKTLSSAHLSVIPEFVEKIELMGAEAHFDVRKTDIDNTLSGSRILFRGLQSSSGDNTANLKSIQGVTCWVLDEAEELTDEEVFDRVDLSVRHKTKQNRVIMVMNPSHKDHFIYKRFFESRGVPDTFNGTVDNVTYIHTTYLDNIEHLSDSYIQQINVMRDRRPERYKHQILGLWRDRSEGVVFNNWRIGEFVDTGIVVYGQDYGFSVDPTTLVKVSIDKKKKVIYAKELLYRTGMTTSDIFEVNKRYAGDALIIGDSAEPRLIEELRQKGNNIIGAVKGQGSVSGGIALIQDYELVVEGENLVKELNGYVWSDKKSNTPIDASNHILDALRYAVMHQHFNNFDYAIC